VREDLVLSELSLGDADAVLTLYRAVAAHGGGLARSVDEINPDYVGHFLTTATSSGGMSLGACAKDGGLAGEIHVMRMAPEQFQHVLTDLTVAVHPAWQGKGVGTLFKGLIASARTLVPRITWVELVAREGNADAIRLYERLGFRIEGRFVGRVRLADGAIEDDIPMALML